MRRWDWGWREVRIDAIDDEGSRIVERLEVKIQVFVANLGKLRSTRVVFPSAQGDRGWELARPRGVSTEVY